MWLVSPWLGPSDEHRRPNDIPAIINILAKQYHIGLISIPILRATLCSEQNYRYSDFTFPAEIDLWTAPVNVVESSDMQYH